MNNQRLSKIAPALIIISVFLFFFTVWGLAKYYLGQSRLPSELIYGGPLPTNLRALASFRAPEGLTADLYNADAYTKVGFAFSFSKAKQESAISGEELIRVLADTARTRNQDPRLSSFTSRYLSAQFDARRAYDINPVQVVLEDRTVEAAQFRAKSEWHHLAGMINLPHGQFVFQAVRKNSPVDPAVVAAIVSRQIEASKGWQQQ